MHHDFSASAFSSFDHFFFHSLYVELYPFSSLDSFILFPLSISVDKYGLQLDFVCMHTGVTIQV